MQQVSARARAHAAPHPAPPPAAPVLAALARSLGSPSSPAACAHPTHTHRCKEGYYLTTNEEKDAYQCQVVAPKPLANQTTTLMDIDPRIQYLIVSASQRPPSRTPAARRRRATPRAPEPWPLAAPAGRAAPAPCPPTSSAPARPRSHAPPAHPQDDGFCAEEALQIAALYHGVWLPQLWTRRAANQSLLTGPTLEFALDNWDMVRGRRLRSHLVVHQPRGGRASWPADCGGALPSLAAWRRPSAARRDATFPPPRRASPLAPPARACPLPPPGPPDDGAPAH